MGPPLAAFDDAYDSKYGMCVAGIPGDMGIFAVAASGIRVA